MVEHAKKKEAQLKEEDEALTHNNEEQQMIDCSSISMWEEEGKKKNRLSLEEDSLSTMKQISWGSLFSLITGVDDNVVLMTPCLCLMNKST